MISALKFGLKETDLKRIVSIFQSFPGIDEAVIYGSRAKGNFRDGSDIDISLKGDDLTLSILNSISRKLDDLLLPFIIDLSVYNQIDNLDLIEHINRVGISFYKRFTSPTQ